MAREPMVYLSVMVPEEMKAELEAEAERAGRSLAEVTRDRLEAGRAAEAARLRLEAATGAGSAPQ